MDQIQRRRFLIAGGAILGAPLASFAQRPKAARMPRIGWLLTSDAASGKMNLDAFRDGLRELNYVEGRNVVIEYRWADGNVARLPDLAKELVQQNVDVIVAGALFGAQAAKSATSVIPIVSAGAADLAEAGLIASLGRPGGNLTGFVVVHPETAGKQIEVMKEVLARAKRATVLWAGPGNPFFERQRKELEKAASHLSLSWDAPKTRGELEASFGAIGKSRPDFLVVLSTAFYFTYRKDIAKFAAQVRVPAVYGFREFVDDGGLISYGANIPESFRRAAGYVDKILKGAKPAELPVQLPSKLELVINMKAARALGLKIPPSILLRADRVIE